MLRKENPLQVTGVHTPILAELVEPAQLTFPRSGGVGVRLCGAWESMLPALVALGSGRGSSHGYLGSLEVEASFPEMQLSRTGCHALSQDGSLELRLPSIEEILCYEKSHRCLEVHFRRGRVPVLTWIWSEMPHPLRLRTLLAHAGSAMSGCAQCPRSRRPKPEPPRQAGQLPPLEVNRLADLLQEARSNGCQVRLVFFSEDCRHAAEFSAGWSLGEDESTWQLKSPTALARLDRRALTRSSLFFQEIPPAGWKVLCCAPGALGFATLQVLPELPPPQRLRVRSRTVRFS